MDEPATPGPRTDSAGSELRPRRFTRRRALAGLLGGSTLLGGGYTLGIEPNWMVVERVRVPVLPAGASPLKILQLSDFHASLSTPLSRIGEAIETALGLEADLCVLTGDYITQSLDEPDAYAAVLTKLSAALPTFGVLGNHDGGSGWDGTTGHCPPDHDAVDALLDDAGILRLHNRAAIQHVDDRELMLVGTGDLWQEECDVEAAFGERDALLAAGADPVATVVLTHNPDARTEMADRPWDLALTGHTHGGQIKVPFLGAPVLPVTDRRFAEGLVPWEGRYIYVTRGIGSLLSIRFNCPPEITLVELVARET